MIYASFAVLTAAMAGCSNNGQTIKEKEGEKKEIMKTQEIVLTDANFDTEAGKGVVLIDF